MSTSLHRALADALNISGTEANMFGSANQRFLDDLNAAGVIPQCKKLAVPAILRGNFPVRPIQVLHELSRATSPSYEGNLHDMYMQWGLLRYLGFFKNENGKGNKAPTLGVSEAGCNVRGTQRRATSEELGIGFGMLLAKKWFQNKLGPGTSINSIDLDAYASKYGGSSSTRPDYLLIASDARKRDSYRLRLLECKGAQWMPSAHRQMKKAVQQLGHSDFTPIPDGIAVSSITWGDQICCLAVEAVETCSKVEASYAADWEADDVRQSPGYSDQGIASEAFLASIFREMWAQLASFGCNLQARDAWSGQSDSAHSTPQDVIGERNEFQTPYGRAIGVTEIAAVGGIQLHATRAVDVRVDDALSRGEPQAVIEAQSRFAEVIERTDETQADTSSRVFSAAPDGSIFILER